MKDTFQSDPSDADSTCLNCAGMVRFVHKCLENEVNFYRQSGDRVESGSEDVVEGNNRGMDPALEDKDDEHQDDLTHKYEVVD